MRQRLAAYPRWVVVVAVVLASATALSLLFLVAGSAGRKPVASHLPTATASASSLTSATATPVATPTILATPTASSTPTATGTPSAPTPTATVTPTSAPTATPVPTATPTATAAPTPNRCIDVTTWSVDQRLNQLLMVSGDFSNIGASAPYASAGVGAFVFFGQPSAGSGPSITSGMAGLYNDARAAGRVLPWISTDEEGGSIARLSNVIGALPSPRQMAAGWTPAQVQSMMATHAAAMWNLGVIMDLAPVLDTASPFNTIADENERSFSENGYTAAAYGVAYANGLRSSGVVPVAKHFPGLGHASANTDLGPATDPSLAQLQTDDLIPFEHAIADGVRVIMISHASVPGLTGTVPASLSPATYQYLRGTLHFSGVTLTDSLSAGAITAYGDSQATAAVQALEAGADMAMIHADAWAATLSALEHTVNSGTLPISQVNQSVVRILQAKGAAVC